LVAVRGELGAPSTAFGGGREMGHLQFSVTTRQDGRPVEPQPVCVAAAETSFVEVGDLVAEGQARDDGEGTKGRKEQRPQPNSLRLGAF